MTGELCGERKEVCEAKLELCGEIRVETCYFTFTFSLLIRTVIIMTFKHIKAI